MLSPGKAWVSGILLPSPTTQLSWSQRTLMPLAIKLWPVGLIICPLDIWNEACVILIFKSRTCDESDSECHGIVITVNRNGLAFSRSVANVADYFGPISK